MVRAKSDLSFRGWYYFRQGWANYFTFVFAAVNTLTVTYYLAIERYPSLNVIFPNFIQYVIIVTVIGIPLLVGIGYLHWKKSAARKAEIDIMFESHPYLNRLLVNSELILKLNLKFNEKLLKMLKDKLTDEEVKELTELQKEFSEFVKERKFRSPMDWQFFEKIDNFFKK